MQTFPTPIHEILTRVERRELQVDVAAGRIFEIFHSPHQLEGLRETPEDAIGQGAQGSPAGVLTTYNAMDHHRRDNGEGEDDLVTTLVEAGFEVVEGADAVREAIESVKEEGVLDA